jgi:hypothetical protein
LALVLFIENREKTFFWEHVAAALSARGHRVAWLVQNPQFMPRMPEACGEIHVLPFPARSELSGGAAAQALERRHPLLSRDRGRLHFDTGTSHYAFYSKKIRDVLERVRPDFVVGESTLFHELMAIDLCREAGIPFLHPNANRYPANRLSVFAYDRQDPVACSREQWPESKCRELAERIGSGREVPFYMQRPDRLQKVKRQAMWALTRGRVWWGRLRGERYNTPSLVRKLVLQRRLRANLRRWKALERVPRNPARTILYPLQMEPENTIDVWAYPYTD